MLIYMAQESRELLLKDLCGRLPYGVKVDKCNHIYELRSILKCGIVLISDIITNKLITTNIENITPYLFSPQSLPIEQREEICKAADGMECGSEIEKVAAMVKVIDLMNKYKVDYRDLIPNGLAKDATGLNLYEK